MSTTRNKFKLYLLPFSLSLVVGIFDYSIWHSILAKESDDYEEGTDSPIPLVAFLLISVAIDTFFILVGFGTPNFFTTVAYLAMIYGSMIALLFFAVYLKDDIEPIPFARSPGLKGFVIAVVLGLVILLANIAATSLLSLSLFPSSSALLQGVHFRSFLFVPQFFSVAQTGGSNSGSTFSNIVFEIILTAPGEEGLKAALLYGSFLLTKSEAVSVIFSVAVWASFHTILVSFTWLEVALAFGSGLIMYLSWRYSGSILSPIICHGIYDASVVGLSSI